MFLNKQLYIIRMAEGMDLLAHLNSFTRLIAQLFSVEFKIEEDDKWLLLLPLFPDSYDHVVSITLYGKDTLMADDLTSTFLSNKMLKKQLGRRRVGDSRNQKKERSCQLKRAIKGRQNQYMYRRRSKSHSIDVVKKSIVPKIVQSLPRISQTKWRNQDG